MTDIGRVDESTWFFRNVVSRRVTLGFVLAAVFLLFASPSRATVFLGFWVATGGEAVRTWASGIIVKNRMLATEGPYRLVRNPLYVGNFLIGLGVSIMGGHLWFLVLFLVAFVPVYRDLVRKEEKHLLDLHGDAFREYCRKVPRFIPDWKNLRIPPAPYDVQRMLRKHREWQAWVGLYAVTVYLLVISG